MKKIVITGPESSGKSTLALELSDALHGWYVSEAAREYLDGLERPYEEPDLLAIAREQLELEDQLAEEFQEEGLMVCDTDLITIRIWSEEKYGRCDPWIVEQTERRHYDHWLLCKPDMPWAPDPQRENPYDRDRLFVKYEAMLRYLEKPYTVVDGGRRQRLLAAVETCGRLLR
ncbi:MAG: ATP-binding protein [Flavobacteriales bacterium]